MLKIGIDVHGVLDSSPLFFAQLSRLLVENGHEVHILTGAEHTQELERHLREDLGLSWTHFFSITSYHKQAGTEITYIDGNPYMDNKIWNRSKSEYCKSHGINLHIDDSDIYGKYFSTPYARFDAKKLYDSLETMEASEPGINGSAFQDNVLACDDGIFQKPSVTVDIALCTVIDDSLKVLLTKREHHPFKGAMAIPGKFIDISRNENLEETASRIIKEKTGLTNLYIEQLKTYGDVNRDPRTRVITTAYYALLPAPDIESMIKPEQSNTDGFHWYSLMNFEHELNHQNNTLAFDHSLILSDLRDRLQGKISYTPIAFELLPDTFTWTELRSTYEAVLDKPIDPANFKKKIKSMYIIKELKTRKSVSGAGRPPAFIRCDGVKTVCL